MKVYNKLVRDNIPDIILKDNCLPTTRILDDKEYLEELNKKLTEEINEYLESNSIEELCDVTEVILAILDFNNIDHKDFENTRIKKAAKRGAFKKKIFLEKVVEPVD